MSGSDANPGIGATLRRRLTWRPGRLASGTLHGTGWQAARIMLQAANVVVLTHALGARGYGTLSGVTALYTVLAQLVGCGAGIALVRDVARHPEQAVARWAATRRLFLASGVLIFLLVWPCANWLLGAQLQAGTLGVLALAELVAAPAVTPSAYWLLAIEKSGWCNAVLTLPTAARFGASLFVLLQPQISLGGYALAYLALIGGLALLTVAVLRPAAAGPGDGWRARDLARLAKDGVPYVVGGVSLTASAEIDKTLLLRLLGPLQAGQYAAAFRVAQAATIPVNAFIVALSPRLFRADRPSEHAAATPYLTAALVYGCAAALGAWLISPHLGWLLGTDFDVSSAMLRLLSLYIVGNCLRQVVSAMLTGADLQWSRNLAEATSTIFIIGANLVAIPLLGWKAATTVAIAGDLLVTTAGLILLRRGALKQRPATR